MPSKNGKRRCISKEKRLAKTQKRNKKRWAQMYRKMPSEMSAIKKMEGRPWNIYKTLLKAQIYPKEEEMTEYYVAAPKDNEETFEPYNFVDAQVQACVEVAEKETQTINLTNEEENLMDEEKNLTDEEENLTDEEENVGVGEKISFEIRLM